MIRSSCEAWKENERLRAENSGLKSEIKLESASTDAITGLGFRDRFGNPPRDQEQQIAENPGGSFRKELEWHARLRWAEVHHSFARKSGAKIRDAGPIS